MKTLTAFLTALTLTTTAAVAQTAPAAARPATENTRRQGGQGGRQGQATPEQRADLMTRQLTKQLGLSPEQVAKVQPLALSNAQQLEAVRSKYATATDRKGMGQELKTLKDQNDAQLRQILTPAQLAQYSQLQADRLAKRQQRGQGRRANDQADF
jgi:Spy/CpxP family protein refolding chaperone